MHTVERADTTAEPTAIGWLVARRGVAGAAAACGVAAMAAGTVLVRDANGLLRAVLMVSGLVAIGVGLDRAMKRLVGPAFPTGFVLSVAWLASVVFFAAFANVLPLPEARVPANALNEPALARPDLLSAHPLGTDSHGLDLLGGLAFGGRVSLIVAVGAAVIGVLIGGSVGLVAGYVRGRFDRTTALLTDSMLAFPPLILLLGLVAVVDASVAIVTIGLAMLAIPGFIRLARANTLAIAQREFVVASVAIGATRRRIVIRELLPNVLWPVLSYTVVVLAALIVAEAGLSFLGLSVQRPNPTWGNMIAAGQASYDRHPHLVAVPAACMFLTVFALNVVGERLRVRYGNMARNR